MSHKKRILQMLEAAGERGVSSKILYREFMGRGAARVKDLRNEGVQIDSEERDPTDPKYCIYRLVGVGAGNSLGASASTDSDEGSSPEVQPNQVACSPPGSPVRLFEVEDKPSMFDWDAAA